MQSISCEKKRPTECSEAELAAFMNLVLRGRQVEGEGLLARIKAAVWLGFGRIGKTVVSVAAMKRPSGNYRNRVFQNAGYPERATQFELEFGWAFTVLEFEGNGLASGLADLLLEELGESVFATTSIDNRAMKHILGKRQFVQLGEPYPGRSESKVLYVRAQPFLLTCRRRVVP